jgi:hypothetical protein
MYDEPYIESYTMGRMPMSASQELDRNVTIQEMPYGYDGIASPSDEQNASSKLQMYGHKKNSKRGF